MVLRVGSKVVQGRTKGVVMKTGKNGILEPNRFINGVIVVLFMIAIGSIFFLASRQSEDGREPVLAEGSRVYLEPPGNEGIVIDGVILPIGEKPEILDTHDRIISFNFEQSRTFTLVGEPRMVSPEAVINFSGDKVTYSGDLPVDEAAKIFFDVVMGYVKEARICK